MKVLILLICYLSYINADLGDYISQQVHQNLKGLENLGSRIQQDVQAQLAPLQNLGSQIESQVYQGLKPVRELGTRLKISHGTDGITVATYSPSGRQLIIQNNMLYQCAGIISDSSGGCSGPLRRLTFDKKEDFCFANINSVINNWYCITVSGSASFSYINGQVKCTSQDGNPSLLITAEDYHNLCYNVASSVNYKYFTYGTLSDIGEDVHCSGTRPLVCTFTENIGSRNPGVIQSAGSSYNILYKK